MSRIKGCKVSSDLPLKCRVRLFDVDTEQCGALGFGKPSGWSPAMSHATSDTAASSYFRIALKHSAPSFSDWSPPTSHAHQILLCPATPALHSTFYVITLHAHTPAGCGESPMQSLQVLGCSPPPRVSRLTSVMVLPKVKVR
jgi:hypothetical protein